MIGESLGNYRIGAIIGEGGMGIVYQAEHVLIGRRVAIKQLLPDASRDDELVERFFNEARAAAKIQHPGLVEVFDFGHAVDGSAYIVMELLDGESLAARIARDRPLVVGTALAIARQVASALHAAHEQGIVHRDLKPENLFLVTDRDAPSGVRTKVLDFGIAKLAVAEDQRSVKTKTGVMFGTPRYMAPEQCRNATNVDRRADVYALGCILYEMLTGAPPYEYDNWAELVAAHMHEAPPRPSARDATISADIDAIVLRAMAKQPPDRFETMAELATAVELSWRTTASGSRAAMFTPPAGVSLTAAARSNAETAPTLASTEPLASRRRPPWIALGSAVTLAAAVAAYVAFGAREDRTPPRPPEPSAAVVPVDAAIPAIAGDAPEARASDAPAATAPQVQLAVTSIPAGADVYRAADGVRLGKTPFHRTFERTDGEIELIVKLAGYRDARVALPTSNDGDRTVQLVRLRATQRPDERRGSAAKPAGSGATVLDPYEEP
jgi:tRNA A-37 threonylcarbamoyl transferase component Bud32